MGAMRNREKRLWRNLLAVWLIWNQGSKVYVNKTESFQRFMHPPREVPTEQIRLLALHHHDTVEYHGFSITELGDKL